MEKVIRATVLGRWGKKLAYKKGQKRETHTRVFKRRDAKPHGMTTLCRKERPRRDKRIFVKLIYQ
jgi:hypothetical protein